MVLPSFPKMVLTHPSRLISTQWQHGFMSRGADKHISTKIEPHSGYFENKKCQTEGDSLACRLPWELYALRLEIFPLAG